MDAPPPARLTAANLKQLPQEERSPDPRRGALEDALDVPSLYASTEEERFAVQGSKFSNAIGSDTPISNNISRSLARNPDAGLLEAQLDNRREADRHDIRVFTENEEAGLDSELSAEEMEKKKETMLGRFELWWHSALCREVPLWRSLSFIQYGIADEAHRKWWIARYSKLARTGAGRRLWQKVTPADECLAMWLFHEADFPRPPQAWAVFHHRVRSHILKADPESIAAPFEDPGEPLILRDDDVMNSAAGHNVLHRDLHRLSHRNKHSVSERVIDMYLTLIAARGNCDLEGMAVVSCEAAAGIVRGTAEAPPLPTTCVQFVLAPFHTGRAWAVLAINFATQTFELFCPLAIPAALAARVCAQFGAGYAGLMRTGGAATQRTSDDPRTWESVTIDCIHPRCDATDSGVLTLLYARLRTLCYDTIASTAQVRRMLREDVRVVRAKRYRLQMSVELLHWGIL